MTKKEIDGEPTQSPTALRPGAVSVAGPGAVGAASSDDEDETEGSNNVAISKYQALRASQQYEGSTSANAEEEKTCEDDAESGNDVAITNYQSVREAGIQQTDGTKTHVEDTEDGGKIKIAEEQALHGSEQDAETTTTNNNATDSITVENMVRRSEPPVASAASERSATTATEPTNGELLVEAQVVIEDESKPNNSNATTNKRDVDDGNIYNAEYIEDGVIVNKRRLCRIAGGAIVLLLVVVGATVGGLCAKGRCSRTGPVPDNVDLVTFSTDMIVDFINNVTYSPVPLRHIVPTETASSSPATPEEQALAWLVEADTNKPTAELQLIQRYALATLYFGTNGDAWEDNANWLNPDECSWRDINCGSHEDGSSTGTVEEIQLSEGNLEGKLSADLGLLSDLRVFSMIGNLLSGSIPSSLGIGWGKLEVFEVYANFLSSTIPSSLGRWSNLELFDIEDNTFSSSLPESIGNWANSIQIVYFAYNDLTGSLPTSIKDWVTIEQFHVNDNAFIGSPFSLMVDWIHIRLILLDLNAFNGTLPAWLGNLQEMEYFSIESNDFTGSLPEEISKWHNLTVRVMLLLAVP